MNDAGTEIEASDFITSRVSSILAGQELISNLYARRSVMVRELLEIMSARAVGRELGVSVGTVINWSRKGETK